MSMMKKAVKLKLAYTNEHHKVYKGTQPETGLAVEYYTYEDGDNPVLLVIDKTNAVVVHAILPK
jgi:hypothetical protein